ncbi:hypothetical protein ACHAXS_004661 [Conticribra weissflogii]
MMGVKDSYGKNDIAPSTISPTTTKSQMNHNRQNDTVPSGEETVSKRFEFNFSTLPTASRRRRSSITSSYYPNGVAAAAYDGASIHNTEYPYLAREDEDLLSRVIADAGLHAFGAVFVERWVASSDGLTITRPSGGHWMNPSFMQSVVFPEKATEVNESAPNCAPGESLAGTLFKESYSWGGRVTGNRKVYWRQLKSLIDDPFIQHGNDDRMTKIRELGIGLVATVPFTLQGRNGIVMFMSRSTACIERLRAPENERYLISATDLIGAAFAIRIPRRNCAKIRSDLFRSAVEKVKRELRSKKPRNFADVVLEVAYRRREDRFSFLERIKDSGEEQDTPQCVPQIASKTSFGSQSSKIPDAWRRALSPCEAFAQNASDAIRFFAHHVTVKLKNSIRKYRGAGVLAPPRHSLVESLTIFVGVFLVMLALVGFNQFLGVLEPDLTYEGAWYASSICIIFALTAAPVGQPRQIFLAHTWCILVGFVFQQIPTGGFEKLANVSDISNVERVPGLPLTWKQAFSTAFGISGQAYLGIIHPPASSLAFIFASEPAWKFKNLLPLLGGDVIMVIMSMIILNLGEDTQYPMYWLGLSWKSRSVRILEKEKSCCIMFKKCWRDGKQHSSSSSLNGGIGMQNNTHPLEVSLDSRKWRSDDGDLMSEI